MVLLQDIDASWQQAPYIILSVDLKDARHRNKWDKEGQPFKLEVR
jgi:hypothetical protein